MQRSFLNNHIKIFLSSLSSEPLDQALGRYFRSHKSLGSKDRKIIGDTLFGMARWKSLLDFFQPQDPLSWYQNIDWDAIEKNPNIPAFAKVGLTPYLYDRFCKAFGEKKALELGRILNENAPIVIRVNTLKTDRDSLLKRLQEKFSVSLCEHSPLGLRFSKREPLFATEEFKEGLFEVQDEGSQLVALCVKGKPGDIILDYCSGSGGKTLGFGGALQNKGQIYLHDIRLQTLLEAKKRLKRAGMQNAQCLPPQHPQLKRLRNQCDWVLADVPCSGTGTLRRNPDQKGKIDAAMIERLISDQRKIMQEALSFVKKGGKLVYATCSILPEENEQQVAYFLKHLPLELEGEPLSILPQSNGPDGFFCAVFRLMIR